MRVTIFAPLKLSAETRFFEFFDAWIRAVRGNAPQAERSSEEIREMEPRRLNGSAESQNANLTCPCPAHTTVRRRRRLASLQAKLVRKARQGQFR
jgi:hypothetical protein